MPTRETLLLLGVFILIFGVRLNLIELFAFITPYYDDWRAGAYMRLYALGELTWEGVFHPFNGHIALWSNLSNFALFEMNQRQWDPRLHMLVNALIWSFSGTLLTKIALNQHRKFNSYAFIILILVLWLLPFSLLNALWGVQTHNYLMILFAVAAIWLISGKPWAPNWYLGVLLSLAAPLTMGGGAFISLSVLSVTLLRAILEPESRPKLFKVLILALLMAVFSAWVLYFVSGGHEVYYAESLPEFLTTLLKTLSFPLSENLLPSVVMLAPIALLAFRSIQFTELGNRMNYFVLTLSVFVLVMAVAIAYARGADGRAPSERYFEFLELYVIVSGFALFSLQTPKYVISKPINSVLVGAWLTIILIGISQHSHRIYQDIGQRSDVKPAEEDVVLRYLDVQKLDVLSEISIYKLPFAGARGLQVFIDSINPLNMMPFELQFHKEFDEVSGSGEFIQGGANIDPDAEVLLRYRYESVIGSYLPERGGAQFTGSYTSTLFAKTNRPFIMLPTMGLDAGSDMSLKIVDEVTGEEIVVQPVATRGTPSGPNEWQQTFIKAPKNSYRMVATDASDSNWFAIAAPRTVGLLSMATLKLVANGSHIWLLGLLIILYSVRRELSNLFLAGSYMKAASQTYE